MFHDMKYLNRFLRAAKLWVLRNDQVNIHVGMYEVAIHGPSDRPFDAHEAMFLSALEYCVVFQVLRVAGVVDVGLDPADVFAATETPLFEAFTAHV